MARAKCKAVMNECGVDHDIFLGPVEQVGQVAQVPVTAPDSVPSAVLVQNKHLAWTEPSLKTKNSRKSGLPGRAVS